MKTSNSSGLLKLLKDTVRRSACSMMTYRLESIFWYVVGFFQVGPHSCVCYLQGTAGVALAGLLGTVRAQGLPLSDFAKQKIVVVGAGR